MGFQQFKFKLKPNKMAEFRCEKCKTKKTILKQTLVFRDGDFIVKEAKCKCGNYMKDMTKYKGFGTSFQAPTDKYK